MMINIQYLYEEACYKQFPNWTVADEDKRIFREEPFGRQGDAWATAVTAHLAEVSALAESLSRYLPFFHSQPMPLSTWLQLRVCSPAFEETDGRFLRDGKHLALVQDEFNLKSVEEYIDRRIQETSNLKLPRRYDAWERHFHLFDPDDD